MATRATYGNTIGVLLADALGLGLALLEGVLVLELAVELLARTEISRRGAMYLRMLAVVVGSWWWSGQGRRDVVDAVVGS